LSWASLTRSLGFYAELSIIVEETLPSSLLGQLRQAIERAQLMFHSQCCLNIVEKKGFPN
jgi:hypothetical protein